MKRVMAVSFLVTCIAVLATPVMFAAETRQKGDKEPGTRMFVLRTLSTVTGLVRRTTAW